MTGLQDSKLAAKGHNAIKGIGTIKFSNNIGS